MIFVVFGPGLARAIWCKSRQVNAAHGGIGDGKHAVFRLGRATEGGDHCRAVLAPRRQKAKRRRDCAAMAAGFAQIRFGDRANDRAAPRP
jgi:hypothetical protein